MLNCYISVSSLLLKKQRGNSDYVQLVCHHYIKYFYNYNEQSFDLYQDFREFAQIRHKQSVTWFCYVFHTRIFSGAESCFQDPYDGITSNVQRGCDGVESKCREHSHIQWKQIVRLLHWRAFLQFCIEKTYIKLPHLTGKSNSCLREAFYTLGYIFIFLLT